MTDGGLLAEARTADGHVRAQVKAEAEQVIPADEAVSRAQEKLQAGDLVGAREMLKDVIRPESVIER